jgi:hypothetical protein
MGDSGKGPVGMCARVKADSKEEALVNLRAALLQLDETIPLDVCGHDVQYINVYLNPEALTINDIYDTED